MSNFNTQSLVADLKRFRFAKLSPYPDHVYSEKKGKIIKHELIETVTGMCLILTLNVDGEQQTIVTPDIESIEYNNLSNSEFVKYYFNTLNKSIYSELLQIEDSKSVGASYDEEEYEALMDNRLMITRIELTNR
ncbi:hypothetical protein P4K96_04190 [Bacillus cereus]|nr:hypothetical protein [Bacillus cereus]